MTAFEIPGNRFTLNTAADIERGRFVKVDENGLADYATSASDAIIGVSYTEAGEGKPLSIAIDGIVMVEADAAITVGAEVGPSEGGKAKAGKGGVALTGATAAGEMISVLIGAGAAE